MQEYLRKKEISVIGGNAPKPVCYFEEASFPEDIMSTIRQQGFVEPTPIQAQVCVCVSQCVVIRHLRVKCVIVDRRTICCTVPM